MISEFVDVCGKPLIMMTKFNRFVTFQHNSNIFFGWVLVLWNLWSAIMSVQRSVQTRSWYPVRFPRRDSQVTIALRNKLNAKFRPVSNTNQNI